MNRDMTLFMKIIMWVACFFALTVSMTSCSTENESAPKESTSLEEIEYEDEFVRFYPTQIEYEENDYSQCFSIADEGYSSVDSLLESLDANIKQYTAMIDAENGYGDVLQKTYDDGVTMSSTAEDEQSVISCTLMTSGEVQLSYIHNFVPGTDDTLDMSGLVSDMKKFTGVKFPLDKLEEVYQTIVEMAQNGMYSAVMTNEDGLDGVGIRVSKYDGEEIWQIFVQRYLIKQEE